MLESGTDLPKSSCPAEPKSITVESELQRVGTVRMICARIPYTLPEGHKDNDVPLP